MAIVMGNANRDILIDTGEADRISVLNADDMLSGLERDDLLNGDEGDDTPDGDAQRDLIDERCAGKRFIYATRIGVGDWPQSFRTRFQHRIYSNMIAASVGDQLSGSRLDHTLQGGQSTDRFIREPGWRC